MNAFSAGLFSASKMHLRSGFRPEPHWGRLQSSPRPTSLLQEVFLRAWPSSSNFKVLLETNFWLRPWDTWAIKIAAKGSSSKKRLKNTAIDGSEDVEIGKSCVQSKTRLPSPLYILCIIIFGLNLASKNVNIIFSMEKEEKETQLTRSLVAHCRFVL